MRAASLASAFNKNSIRNHHKRRRVARRAFGISFQYELNKEPLQDDAGSQKSILVSAFNKNSMGNHHRFVFISYIFYIVYISFIYI